MGGKLVNETKKQNVSVRMSSSDLRKLKEIALRLQVRGSDVFRFAVRNTLAKLSPLNDATLRGRDLLLMLMELGPELASYLDIDAGRLNDIVNEGVESEKRVAKEDIELLTMHGAKERYIYAKLKGLHWQSGQPQGAAALVRQYLYEKYVNREMAMDEHEKA